MISIQNNRSLSEFSTFGIGGPIRHFLEIRSLEEAQAAYSWAKANKVPVRILGKGSNCLFSDAPFEGLALLNKIDFCTFGGPCVAVGAGYNFAFLGVQTARKGLSGLEFAAGIPASVGGAIFMNAGANGQETSHVLESVVFLSESGVAREFSKNELPFSYRSSPFQSMQGCILSAKFALQENLEARASQLRIIEARMKTQPLKDRSAGCVFRNPPGPLSAGALIERCGLKGFRMGGAEVSSVHANFLVNRGGASAREMRALIEHVREIVHAQTGIQLELEIRVYD